MGNCSTARDQSQGSYPRYPAMPAESNLYGYQGQQFYYGNPSKTSFIDRRLPEREDSFERRNKEMNMRRERNAQAIDSVFEDSTRRLEIGISQRQEAQQNRKLEIKREEEESQFKQNQNRLIAEQQRLARDTLQAKEEKDKTESLASKQRNEQAVLKQVELDFFAQQNKRYDDAMKSRSISLRKD